MKDYIIYLAPDCHECEELKDYIQQNNITIESQLLTKEQWTEKGIFVFPTLVDKNEIIAYGSDIIKFLK